MEHREITQSVKGVRCMREERGAHLWHFKLGMVLGACTQLWGGGDR